MTRGRYSRIERCLRRWAGLTLTLMVFVTVFADAIAADSPYLIVSKRGLYLLPVLTMRSRFADHSATFAEADLRPDEHAFWPLLRSGPSRPTAEPFLRPSRVHPLGTDAFGRDVVARLVHGTRTTVLLAAVVTALALTSGCVLGTLAAMYGGMLDSVVQRVVETLAVFPAVVLIALLSSFDHRSSLLSMGVVLTLVRCAEAAKLSRLLVVGALEQEWVLAARALGASAARVAWVHIGPHLATPLLTSAAFSIGAVVLTDAAVSFLGLGMPIEPASWGEMLGEVRWGAGPYVLFPPVIALAILVGAAFLLAQRPFRPPGPIVRGG